MCHNHCIDVDGVLQRNGSPIVQNGRVIPLVDKDGGAAAQFTVTTILMSTINVTTQFTPTPMVHHPTNKIYPT